MKILVCQMTAELGHFLFCQARNALHIRALVQQDKLTALRRYRLSSLSNGLGFHVKSISGSSYSRRQAT